jgi:hypothetical protein
MVTTLAFAIAVLFLAVWFTNRVGTDRPAAVRLLIDVHKRAHEEEEPRVSAMELGLVLATAGAICLTGILVTAIPHAG